MAGVLIASPGPSSQFVQLQCSPSPSPPPANDSSSGPPQESQLTASTQESSSRSCERALQASQPLRVPPPPTTTTSQLASHPEEQRQPSGSSPLTASSSTLPPSTSKYQLKVIDFIHFPKPTTIDIPLDEEWVVRLPKEARRIPGGREHAAARWERNHSHLYRGYGNRADPPGTIPKKWGGFPKEVDDAFMRAEEDRILSWERRLRERGLSPTESASSSPRSPPTQEEQDAWFAAYELNIKRDMNALKANGGEPPPPTQRNVITKIASKGVTYSVSEFLKLKEEERRKALEAANSRPSEDPPRPEVTFGNLRVCPTLFFDSDNKGKQREQSPSGLQASVELSPKRKRQPLENDEDPKEQKPKSLEEPLAKRTKTVPDTQVEHPPRYSLRNRTPQSQTPEPVPKPSTPTSKRKSKGKGKASGY